MGRPFYSYEAEDADLDWLVSNFLYERPEYCPIEVGLMPIVLIPCEDEAWSEEFEGDIGEPAEAMKDSQT